MKTLLFISLLILSACGSKDEDPGPQYNCESLQKASDNAKTAMNNLTKNQPWDNNTQAVKDKWQADFNAARQAYIDAEKLVGQHCK